MRKLSLCLAALSAAFSVSAQNSFPASGSVGIGTASPSSSVSLHIRGNTPTIQLESIATTKTGVIRGLNNTWILGYNGESGVEDISVGAQDGSGTRTLSFAAGGFGRMKILANGYVGIGITSPTAPLHVKTAAQDILLCTGSSTSGYALSIGVNDDGINISNSSTVRGFRFKNANGLLMDITPGGNVGIGANAQGGYKLAVNGDALFTKVKVKTYANWPDFVFEEKYELPSLQSVESFIRLNKHLPDMPSAAEVASSGIDLAEMNAKLLRKVEELTLYLIEQNKKLELQQKEIDQLKQKR